MNRIVIASGNAGKIEEFRRLLSGMQVELLGQRELGVREAEETGLSFVENALIKARNACTATGHAAIADDSGLEVDHLGGAPGIRSARFAGPRASDPDNNALLLERLEGVPDRQRSARFHCLLVYMRHAEDPTPIICHGVWEGRILRQSRGAGGFGYDPLFYVPTEDMTAAELDPVRKNRLSHRGQAMRELLGRMRHRFDD
jgi:XTP/dITP diphosphohydrolase